MTVTNATNPFARYKPCSLVEDIADYAKNFVSRSCSERDYEVIRRRLGLEGSSVYTLQAVGDNFGITRERVRQLEERAYRRLHNALIKGDAPTEFSVPENIQLDTNSIYQLFISRGDVILEEDVRGLLQKYYNRPVSVSLASIRLLLSIFDYDELTNVIASSNVSLHPAWAMGGRIDRRSFYKAVNDVHSYLMKSGGATQIFDIRAEVNRRRKDKLSGAFIDLALRICQDIEKVDQDSYQIKFEYLSSVGDKAYRILLEEGKPLHQRDIVRGINQKLAKAKSTDVAILSTTANAMVADTRFTPIGRSGIWTLVEWGNVRTDTIVDLMVEYLHLNGKPATPKDIYEYVFSKRPDMSKGSIGSYLSYRKEFIRVNESEYGLAQWNIKPYAKPKNIRRKRSSETLRDRVQSEITAYLEIQPNQQALISVLAVHIKHTTGCKRPTFYRYLAQHPQIKKTSTEKGMACYLADRDKTVVSLFPQIELTHDEQLKANLKRAISHLNLENVDIGLFYFGKIFEVELKSFLMQAKDKSQLAVTQKDLGRLVDMVDCLKRNGIVKDEHVLTFLRQERNERTHGEIPSLADRQDLMKKAPYIAGLFIEHIIAINALKYAL